MSEVTRLSWEGPVVITEQEGGYVSSLMMVGSSEPVLDIENEFEVPYRNVNFAGGKGDQVTLPGRWRLTLEKIIEPEAP